MAKTQSSASKTEVITPQTQVPDDVIPLAPKKTRNRNLPDLEMREVMVCEDAIRYGLARHAQGRQGNVVKKWAWEICLRVAQGQPLRQICALSHLPDINTVLNWIHPDHSWVDDDLKQFQLDYARAVKQQNELLMDELVHLSRSARNKDDAAAAKVILEAMKFRLERTQADKYGPTSRVVREDNDGLKDLDAESTANQLENAMLLIAERRRKRGAVDSATQRDSAALPSASLGEQQCSDDAVSMDA